MLQGVLPEYAQLVNELESGTCVAVEVVGSDAYQRLRALCGPHGMHCFHLGMLSENSDIEY